MSESSHRLDRFLGVMSWLAWAVAALMAVVVVYLLVTNRPWAYGFYAENPYAHAGVGLVAAAGAHVLAKGRWRCAAAWRRTIGRAALAGMSAALAFAIGEVGLRVLLERQQRAQSMDRLRALRAAGKKLPVRSSHPMAHIIEPSDDGQLVFALKPNLDMEFGHKALRTNRDGMRSDREFAIPKPPGVTRIVGIGDSGMFGWNVEQGEEYLAVLQREFDRRATGAVEVLNLAVPGYNTQLELRALETKGLRYQPDVVVVGWCDNDYQLPFFMLEKENFRRRDISYLHELLFRRAGFADKVAGVRMRDHRSFDERQVTEELQAGAGAQGVEAAFLALRELSKRERFRLLVFGPIRERERDMFRRLGIEFYSSIIEIPPGTHPEEWSVHFMHPKPEGHRVLGEALAAELERRGWVPSPSAATGS